MTQSSEEQPLGSPLEGEDGQYRDTLPPSLSTKWEKDGRQTINDPQHCTGGRDISASSTPESSVSVSDTLKLAVAVYLAHEIEWAHARERAKLRFPTRKLTKEIVSAEFDPHAATELAELIEHRMSSAPTEARSEQAEGEEYEIARKNVGTLLGQIKVAEALNAEAVKVIREQDKWHSERWEGCLEEAQQASAEGSQEAERQWMARADDHARRMNVLSAFLNALKEVA